MEYINLIIVSTLLFFGLTQVGSMQIVSDEFINSQEYQRIKELRPLSVEFLEYFKNITQTDLDLAHNRLPSQQDLQCLTDMTQLMKGLSSGSFWALKMIDSWGSFPNGLLYGNVIDMGNYDECIGINKAISDNYKINGKYCFAKISLQVDIRIAVCFPSSCSAAHMDIFFKQLLNKLLNVNLSKNIVSEETCKTAVKNTLDGLTIFTIVLLSVLGASMILATICDYFFYVEQDHLPTVVKAFSARANSRLLFRLVEPKSNPNVIDCLHGLRCMSLIWVIFGHLYLFAVMAPNINSIALIRWLQSPFASFLLHAQFSVDTFFFLSGLLLVMIALRSMEKTNGKLNVPMMYLHRYLRLTPILALAILMYMTLTPLSDGPVTDKARFDSYDRCESTWFWTLLFLQNYATPHLCVHHTWYLAVDMQLYILSPIFLFALYKWGKKAAAAIFVLMLLLSACLFSSMMTNKYPVDLPQGFMSVEGQQKFYFATHTHAAPWLIGLLFGYFLHLNRNKSFKLNHIMIWIGWIISLALMFTSLFALYPAAQWTTPQLTMGEQAAYYTLTRIAWPLSICWVVFACMKGYGGLANSFLSSPLWQPLSKLSYSAYIFHIFMPTINARRLRSSTFFSNYDVMLLFWQNFGFTLLLSYVIYIIIEAPFGVLESLMMPQRKPKPKTETQIESSNVIEDPKLEDRTIDVTNSEQLKA